MKKYFRIFGVFFGFLVLVGLANSVRNINFFQIRLPAPTPTAIPQEPSKPVELDAMVEENAVEVSDFAPGGMVTASRVFMTDPGFVAIHEDAGGTPGDILGVSRLLPEGESESVEVDLTKDTREGDILYAVLYKDDGDGEFDSETDELVTDDEGNIVMLEFTVGEISQVEI